MQVLPDEHDGALPRELLDVVAVRVHDVVAGVAGAGVVARQPEDARQRTKQPGRHADAVAERPLRFRRIRGQVDAEQPAQDFAGDPAADIGGIRRTAALAPPDVFRTRPARLGDEARFTEARLGNHGGHPSLPLLHAVDRFEKEAPFDIASHER